MPGDNTARLLWEAATGTEIRTFSAHTQALRTVAFSPDGTQILTAGYPRAELWDAATGAVLRTFAQGGMAGGTFSSDGTKVLTWSDNQAATIWDAATGD